MRTHTGRFNRKYRLSRPADYNQVFRSPCRSVDEGLVVIAKKNGLDHARLGLAISKKWVRLATDRNRLKRLARENFRKNQEQLSGLDIVIVAKKQTGQLNNKSISNSLQKHWQKLAACKKSS